MTRKLNPLQLMRRLFGPAAPDPSELRVVTPRDVHPDLIEEGLDRTRPALFSARPEFNRANPTLPRFTGPAYEDLMSFARSQTPADDVSLDREIRGFLTDLRAAHGLIKNTVDDVRAGTPGVHQFLYSPSQGAIYGAVRTSPLDKPAAPIRMTAETPDVEEIHALGSLVPGGGSRLLKSAQEAYDPRSRRATSLMSLPRAEPFYERKGMINLERENPEWVGQAVDWQSHVLPRGERFRRGGLARFARA